MAKSPGEMIVTPTSGDGRASPRLPWPLRAVAALVALANGLLILFCGGVVLAIAAVVAVVAVGVGAVMILLGYGHGSLTVNGRPITAVPRPGRRPGRDLLASEVQVSDVDSQNPNPAGGGAGESR